MRKSIVFDEQAYKYRFSLLIKIDGKLHKYHMGLFSSKESAEKAFEYINLSYDISKNTFLNKLSSKLGRKELRDEVYSVMDVIDAILEGLKHIKHKRTLSESLYILNY